MWPPTSDLTKVFSAAVWKKMVRYFLYSAGALLLATAVAKLASGTGQSRILLEHDPVTGFQFRVLLVMGGCLEAIVALACFFSRQFWFPVVLVAWLVTNLTAYRFWLWQTGWNKTCRCLGNLTDALHIPPQTTDMAMKIILAYLLIGCCASLFWLWWQHRKASATIQKDQASTAGSSQVKVGR